VIVGAGFGGLRAARALARAPVDVLLLDKNNYHLFQPLLYQVAVGALPPSEIAYPIRSILRSQRNLEFRVVSVLGFDLTQRVLSTSQGDIPYDHLIVASGAATNTFGVPGVADRDSGALHMPAFGRRLSRAQIEDLVVFVRAVGGEPARSGIRSQWCRSSGSVRHSYPGSGRAERAIRQ